MNVKFMIKTSSEKTSLKEMNEKVMRALDEKGCAMVSNADIQLVIVAVSGGFLSFNHETESFEIFYDSKRYLESIFGSWTVGFSVEEVKKNSQIVIEF